MIALNLPTALEKHFREIVREHYADNVQVAIAALLQLHDKYGWKEQLRQDVRTVRGEVRRRGGLKAKVIDDAIHKYRHSRGAPPHAQKPNDALRPVPDAQSHLPQPGHVAASVHRSPLRLGAT